MVTCMVNNLLWKICEPNELVQHNEINTLEDIKGLI